MQAARGHLVHIPTGRAQDRPAHVETADHRDGPEALSVPGALASAGAILEAECPLVAYRQGAADLCAAYGLASAVHSYGDTSAAAAIADCARDALASARA